MEGQADAKSTNPPGYNEESSEATLSTSAPEQDTTATPTNTIADSVATLHLGSGGVSGGVSDAKQTTTAPSPSPRLTSPVAKSTTVDTKDVEEDDWNVQTVKLTDEEKSEVQGFARAKDEYKLEQTTTRNVIMVGRTRAGKSTFVEVLKDLTHQPPQMTIFSQTANPVFRSFAIGIAGKPGAIAQKFTVNVVDTPGLFEVTEIGDKEARTDEFILSCIQECLKNEITKIHCVMIFMTVTHGITTEDVQAIELFLREFTSSSLTACLCVTRAEGFSDEQQAAVVEELKKHRIVADLIKTHNVQILFSGCVDTNDVAKYSNKDQLKLAYRDLYRMRIKILKTIFAAPNEAAPLVTLAMGKRQIEGSLKLSRECANFLESCITTQQDFSLASNKQQLEAHAHRMQELSKAGSLLHTEPTLAAVTKELEKLLVALKQKPYDPIAFKQMCGPFTV